MNMSNMKQDNVYAKLPAFRSPEQWAKALSHDPWQDLDFAKLSDQNKAWYIDQLRWLYVPNETSVEIAVRLQTLIFSALEADEANRSAIGSAGVRQAGSPKRKLFARGMLISGPTHVGKSVTVKRMLADFPPVIDGVAEVHGSAPLKQIVHLTIPMPADRSKKGFLSAAFLEIDRLLGYNYHGKFFGARQSVESLLVSLINVLNAHRCALLVIEELQPTNLGRQDMLCTYFSQIFLRILNEGIPMVVIGNTAGANLLRSHTQSYTRLTESGHFEIDPYLNLPLPDGVDEEFAPTYSRSRDWKRLVDRLWGKTIFSEPDEAIPAHYDWLWEKTGGMPYFLCKLRARTLEIAMEDEAATRVEKSHVEQALDAHGFVEGRDLISAFTSRDVTKLIPFTDVDRHRYGQIWSNAFASAKSKSAANSRGQA